MPVSRLLFPALTAVLLGWPADSLRAQSGVSEATPVDRIRVVDGFRVELIHSVPKESEGSWVSMTIDPQGRLICSDQYGGLYRLTPGASAEETVVEPIEVEIGHAQGLLHAFGSLYVVVNHDAYDGRGLYRVRDTDGDDRYDSVEVLRRFANEGGEHGPHAVVLGPDGESLYVVVGNQTAITELAHSRVPLHWDEDLLTPRIYGRGFMRGVPAPGGWIARTDPDGKAWELISVGFRNEYDVAFNRDGELFTYDADMEWDLGTPWYRPTRVCHVVSGADWGWRNGSAKWRPHFADTLPPVVDIGPGSPTGVSFGYGAKFPERYREAFFICDWSFGKMYAVHLEPEGATYRAEVEEFLSAQPLPLTDLEVNPVDGALYFAIGGRRVQSGVYRVTWAGDSPGEGSGRPEGPGDGARARSMADLRHAIEAFHGWADPRAVEIALPRLGHADRFIRHAARVALEWQPVDQWREPVLALEDPQAVVTGMVALARVSRGDASVQPAIAGRLASIDLTSVARTVRLEALRAWALLFARTGDPATDEVRARALGQVGPVYPSGDLAFDIEASELLLHLGMAEAVARTVDRLENEPTQEGQIALAKNLRLARDGWTPELRERFFRWFSRAKAYRGGASFAMFVESIRTDALEGLDDAIRAHLVELAEAEPPGGGQPVFTAEPRDFVKAWTVADFDDVLAVGLEGGRDFENGRKMFGAATCFACHRFNGDGGAIGPDLSSAGGRFSPRDLLESIVEPSKEISDQYGAIIITKNDGSQVFGRVGNLNGDTLQVVTDMMKPGDMTGINRNDVKSIEPSPVSMMPPGLLNTLAKDDVLDLLAYILAHGDPEAPVFR